MSEPAEIRSSLSDEQILHIFVEIMDGRGHHGDFLKSFAGAVARANDFNFRIVRLAALELIEKYQLAKYLDTFENGEATA